MVFKMDCETIINIVLGIVVVLLLGNIIYTRFFQKGESLSNTNTNSNLINRIKSANLKVYKSNGCGYCRKLMEVLDKAGVKEHVTLVDVTTPEGQQEYKALGESGVPIILCQTNGERHVGFLNDLNELLNKLKM
jgi:glutaredoxin